MKITEVKSYDLNYPLAEPFANSRVWCKSRTAGVVEIITDAGVTGWGEGLTTPNRQEIDAHIIGRDPLDAAVIWNDPYAQGWGDITAISAVEDVLPLLDMVMVMAVNPGASGQSFIPQSLDKIRRLKGIIDEGKYAAQIEVDGGIKADWTAQDSIKAGATILVAGSAIFNDRESIPDAMKGMRGCILG